MTDTRSFRSDSRKTFREKGEQLMIRRFTAFLLAVLLVSVLLPAAIAEGDGVADGETTPEEERRLEMLMRFGMDAVVETDENNEPVSVNGYPYRKVRASFNVRSVSEKYVTDTDFVEYPFWRPATVYNGSLANMSLLMAVCAARDKLRDEDPASFDPAQNVEAYLEGAGFTDIRKDDYSKETSIWTISTAIGSRRMEHEGEEPFTLIAVGVCGGGYKNEWQSNITAGTGDIHEGFSSATQEVVDRIAGYITTRGIKGRIKIWISGFSRAAAVSNLTAGLLTRTGAFPKEDVYAYTFATPAAVLNPPKTGDENIFNILCPTDIVPQVMPADWGYGRYGTDLYLPVPEFSCIGEYFTQARQEKIKENFGIDINYSPALNLRMRLLVSLALDVVRDRDTYVNHVQGAVLQMMQNMRASSLLTTMRGLLQGMQGSDSATRQEMDDLLNYIVRVFGNAITRTELAAANRNSGSTLFLLATEHREDAYLASTEIIQQGLFDGNNGFTYVMVRGPVELELTENDLYGASVVLKKDGSIVSRMAGSDEPEINPAFQAFYMERIGNTSVAAIPHDARISLSWKAVSDGTVEVRQAGCGYSFSVLYPGMASGEIRVKAGDSGAAWLPEEIDGAVPEGFRKENWNADDLVAFLGISRPIVSWRILVTLVILALGLVLFLLLRGAYFFTPRKGKQSALLWVLLALFIVAVMEAECAFWLQADRPVIRMLWKSLAGAVVTALFFLRHGREEKLLHSALPGLTAAVAADLVMTFEIRAGSAVLLLAHVLLIVFFIRKKPMNRTQWIQWAVLSLIFVGIIFVAFAGKLWMGAVAAPALLLMIYSIGGQDSRTRYAGAALIVSDVLLVAYMTVWPEPLAHILCKVLFAASLMLFALNGKKKD